MQVSINQDDNPARRFALTLKLAWPYLSFSALMMPVLYLVKPLLAVLPGALFLFILYFFRNPRRVIPPGDNLILSPADGVILDLGESYEEMYIKDKAIRVSIFLSILNVHINRSPFKGEVKYRYYRPGKFIPAFKSHASDLNEKNYIGLENRDFKLMVCQITGFIARRIKCWVDEGKWLESGEIIGIIRFGSGAELFLPAGTKIQVKIGDKVKAGETIIGILPDARSDDNG
ncbi:MAG: phosphatidylserine decarboxylase [Firmicutes bacterium ADurb.Bin456]|nr:MAG: phosphatidylserine decarboxylase [Firmicutes bacterium ADurb.Bin456]